MSISIITPWHNTPELIATYEPSVIGAEVIIIDNGSEPNAAAELVKMVDRLGGKVVRSEENIGFSRANNIGYRHATGDIILFLNSDISAPAAWLDQVKHDVRDGALYGPYRQYRTVENVVLPYIEGCCVAATRATWELAGLWPDDLPGMYWDDNIMSYRAMKRGIKLIRTDWPVIHFSNYTSNRTPGAYNTSQNNYAYFAREVALAEGSDG